MYYIIAGVIILLSIAVSLSHFFNFQRSAKIIKAAGALLALSAAALLVCELVSFNSSLSGGMDENTVSWAKDMFYLYFTASGIFTLIIIVLAAISALAQPKKRKTRAALCLLSTVIILMFSILYSFFCESDTVNIAGYVKLCGISQALLFPAFVCITTDNKNK